LLALFPLGSIFVQRLLVTALLPAGQRREENVSRLKTLMPAGSRVLGNEFWSSLANDYRFFSIVHSGVSVNDVDFIVVTGNGSGVPGVPNQSARRLRERSFVKVYDGLSTQPARLLGVPISRSAYGYGFVLLARTAGAAGEGSR
jgi:hypothetical protein